MSRVLATTEDFSVRTIEEQRQLYERANKIIDSWPSWKKEAYNTCAASAHAREIPITQTEKNHND